MSGKMQGDESVAVSDEVGWDSSLWWKRHWLFLSTTLFCSVGIFFTCACIDCSGLKTQVNIDFPSFEITISFIVF